jgi:hypothetical protein
LPEGRIAATNTGLGDQFEFEKVDG